MPSSLGKNIKNKDTIKPKNLKEPIYSCGNLNCFDCDYPDCTLNIINCDSEYLRPTDKLDFSELKSKLIFTKKQKQQAGKAILDYVYNLRKNLYKVNQY